MKEERGGVLEEGGGGKRRRRGLREVRKGRSRAALVRDGAAGRFQEGRWGVGGGGSKEA